MPKKEIDLQEFIDEIYQDYKDNPSDSKYIFFLGAGCSKSSDIPLAWELGKTWHEALKSQPNKLDKFNKIHKLCTSKEINYAKYYFEIFEERFVSSKDQQREIQRITSDKLPSLGYYTLAKLMQIPSFNTVITTNFDDLIQDALIYSGDKRALSITHQDLSKFIERNSTPLIVKVHGDAHLHPFNSTSTTKEIPKELIDAIKQLSNNTKMVFVGYGGNDESIAKLLEYCDRVSYVYWLNDKPPTDVKLKQWWEITKDKVFVNEFDFDKIMLAIKSKFNLEKPNFEKRSKKLEEAYNKSTEKARQALEETKYKTALSSLMFAEIFLDKKEYDQAIYFYEEAIKKNPKSDEAYANMGIAYYMLNKYSKAIESFKKSIDINPKDDYVYWNMGSAYINLKEYDKAMDSYKQSIKINPNYSCSYVKLFELQIIQNHPFDKVLEAKYIELFAKEKEVFLRYEMLKIIENVANGEEVNVYDWKEKYKDIGLGDWSFDELYIWIKTIGDKDKRDRLVEIIEVFKEYRF